MSSVFHNFLEKASGKQLSGAKIYGNLFSFLVFCLEISVSALWGFKFVKCFSRRFSGKVFRLVRSESVTS